MARQKRDRPKSTWIKVVRLDMKRRDLFEDLAQDKPKWKSIIHVDDPNIVETHYKFKCHNSFYEYVVMPMIKLHFGGEQNFIIKRDIFTIFFSIRIFLENDN